MKRTWTIKGGHMKPVLFVMMSALAASAAAADDRKALVGAWRYAGEVDTRADGSPAPASAQSDTEGLLIYSASGFMSVVLMPKNREWLSETATPAELRDTVANGTAYAGRYELDPDTHTVTHITSVSMEPAFQEKRLVRTYDLQGNTLKLTGTFPYEGTSIRFTITWLRVQEPRK
jgi:hypothetical protein